MASQVQPSNTKEAEFLSRVMGSMRQFAQYQDDTLKAKARALIPSDEIHEKARAAYKKERDESHKKQKTLEEHIIKQLLTWYKNTFFKWTNNPPCAICKSGDTKIVGGVAPTPFEQQGLAGMVELYQCSSCGGSTRFPRYNHAGRLLETRNGRCGEWAQCFTLMCVAMGYEARFVNDWTDHVWTEVYLNGRWQHADSCEDALDAPMMYEGGWGKKLSFVVATSNEEIVDVTRRYTKVFYSNEFQQRRAQVGVTEAFVSSTLNSLDQQMKIFLPPYRVQFLSKRKTKEQEEFENGNSNQDLKQEEQQGRISGSTEWKESRGETGGSIPKKEEPLKPVSDFIKSFKKTKPTFSLDDPNAHSKIICVGDASLQVTPKDASKGERDYFNLTKNTSSQKGAIWLKDTISTNHSFTSMCEFIITQDGADGLALVVQNQSLSAIGGDGCNMGHVGIQNSVAVEINTFQNKQIRVLSSSKPIITKSIKNVSDGKLHSLWVMYDSENECINVGLDDVMVLENVKLNLVQACAGNDAWIGHTAATGGYHQKHDVMNWSLSTTTSQFDFHFYKTANVEGINKKLNEFESKETQITFSLEEKRELKELQNDAKLIIKESHYQLLDKFLKNYSAARIFPILDLIRLLLIRHSQTMIPHYAKNNFIVDILCVYKFSELKIYANQMLVYRLLCNMFANSSCHSHLVDQFDLILQKLFIDKTSCFVVDCNDKPQAKSACACVLYNYAVLMVQRDQVDKVLDIVTQCVKLLDGELEGTKDDETITKCLETLKVCMSGENNQVAAIVKSLKDKLSLAVASGGIKWNQEASSLLDQLKD
ncbi:peptide-N4-(N-acetyl-beta-glucosaminyl)asparagine amidase [Acrasis kona]|uniref:Peptide-N4-(N-acetyl-beta-glucosaminyl)asparagine amidase n=1 Tax=Acrasis kona TaxID=1008807 RepID=A0AAW2Z820_9EUKA